MSVHEPVNVASARQAAEWLGGPQSNRAADVQRQVEIIHELATAHVALSEENELQAQHQRHAALGIRRSDIDNRRYQQAAVDSEAKARQFKSELDKASKRVAEQNEELLRLREKVRMHRRLNRIPIRETRDMMLDTREVIDHLHELSNAGVLGVPQADMAKMANVLERQWAWSQKVQTWVAATQPPGWYPLIKEAPKPEFVWKEREGLKPCTANEPCSVHQTPSAERHFQAPPVAQDVATARAWPPMAADEEVMADVSIPSQARVIGEMKLVHGVTCPFCAALVSGAAYTTHSMWHQRAGS